MPMRRYLIGLFAVCLAVTAWAQDYERLSERDLNGTARYVGMSGAMTAIGGDPSAVRDNPAGLGVYRRMELMLSGDYHTHSGNHGVALTEASWVVALHTGKENEGVISHNFMIAAHELMRYGRELQYQETSGLSLGGLLDQKATVDLGIYYPTDPYMQQSQMSLSEYGYVEEYSADWAMNISHKCYIGMGLRMQSYSFHASAAYAERHAEGELLSNTNSVLLSGIGCNMSFGLLWRPVQYLRLGIGYTTPSMTNITEYTSGAFTVHDKDDNRESSAAEDMVYSIRDYHAPQHLSLGAALQLSTWAVISTQYDFTRARYVADRHAWRIGAELIPVPGLYLNVGYAYEAETNGDYTPIAMDYSLDRQDTHTVHHISSQYASAGIGWRGKRTIAELAYQYHWQETDIYAHEAAAPYNDSHATHRVVLSLGWHN